MGKLKRLSSKDKYTYQIAITVFILICILVSILCFQYYMQLQVTLKAENNGYMHEISKQMSTNVNKTIKDNFAVLGTISTTLQSSDISSFEQLQTTIFDQQNYWNYQNLMLIDDKGVAYDNLGNTISLVGDNYLLEAIVGRKNSMSASQVIDGKECIIFAIPLNNIVIDGTNMLALAASYDLSTFDKILSMTAFNEKGYAHIVRKDGTAVIRSSSQNASQTGYNILNSISNADPNNRKAIDNVKSDIANGISGQSEFTINHKQEYMTYTPLETNEWILLTFVSVDVVNAKSQLLLKITLLLCGLITISFALLTAFLMVFFYRNKRRLEDIAYVDAVTGGNTIHRFYQLSQDILQTFDDRKYALIYTNIEKFKVSNEQFGKIACDNMLQGISNGISNNLNSNECMGRLFADNFCVLAEYKDEHSIAARFDDWYKASSDYIKSNGFTWLPLIIEFGVYIIENTSMPLPHIIDRAKLALTDTTCELRGNLKYAIYDEKIRHQLFREKQLEDMMGDALANREFEVYLQPKYLTQSEQIGGAEALVRWSGSSEGMIYPDEFIYLFEKNGFIIQLDLWVFEEVCQTIRKWIDTKYKLVKISVNCSCMHLKNPHFLEQYSAIAKKYDIPPMLIEIEITENAVFEDVKHLSHIIDKIHKAGFGCSMDDFGSGYSSLNLIQDIPVDTLKIDKIFFRNDSVSAHRTESVIGSIISMANALSMETVAEGVEQQHQVDMLKRLNCNYIQGYFFAKPMPISQFETLLFNSQVDDTEHTISEVNLKC